MHVEFFLLILSLLFFISIFADKIGYKYGVPALLLFLVVGMFFGSHTMAGLLGTHIVTVDTHVAEALSTLAMCIILFTGGPYICRFYAWKNHSRYEKSWCI